MLYFVQLAGGVIPECDDFGQGLPILALQTVEQRQPVFNLCQALGGAVDALRVIAHRGANIFNARPGRLQHPQWLLKTGVEARQLRQLLLRTAELGARGGRVIVECAIGAGGGGVEFFGVGQDAFLRLQRLIFARL